MKRTYSTKFGAVGLLRRSFSYVSLSVSHHEPGQFDSHNNRKLFASFRKSKSHARPERYCCPRNYEDPSIKDGFVWTQIIPHVKKDWQLRYLMLFHEKLCYLKETVRHTSKEMQWREIEVKSIVSVKIPSENQIHFVSDTDESSMLYIKINTKSSPTKILFRFKSQQERDEWMTAFLTAKSWSMLNDRITESDEKDSE